jgi:hypothetical protein
MGDGKLALKASYGRYAGAGTAPGASPGPSGSNVNQASVITRTYTRWNGTIPYTPVVADLTGTSGGGGIQKLDTNLVSPYLDEFTAGFELGLHKNYLIGFNAVRKFDKGGSKTLDLAQPYGAYTDLAIGLDPGRNNTSPKYTINGVANSNCDFSAAYPCDSDDSRMYAWSVPRSLPTFGQINQLTTQYLPGEGTRNYTAFETVFQKQYSDKWSLLSAFTVDFNHINNAIPQNPNAAYYNYQIPEWNQSLKMTGTYELPYGIKYGSTYQIQSGQWYSRSAQMRNALNSNVTVRVEGHFGRYPAVKLWDNRISKVFKFGDKQSLEGMFDLYNTLNANTLLSQVTTNGPTFLQPTTAASGATSAAPILPARIFKLGVRYRF